MAATLEQTYGELVHKHGPPGEPRNNFERWMAKKYETRPGAVNSLLVGAEYTAAFIPILGVSLVRAIEGMRRRTTGDRPLREKAERIVRNENQPRQPEW